MADLELGLKYRDKVSEWEGVATGRYIYLNGCVRYQLDGKDKDGKPEGFVFDEAQLELVDAPKVETKTRSTGGPRDNRPVAR